MADLLQGVQDGVAPDAGNGQPPQDFKMPSMEELMEALEKMPGLTEEAKKELLSGINGGSPFGDHASASDFVQPPVVKDTFTEFLMLFSLIALVFIVLVFFGYKLYKSLVERERRREEKKRQKLQKKRK